MPSMLDARVSLSLMDVVRGENQFDEEFEWVEADEVFDLYSVEGKQCFQLQLQGGRRRLWDRRRGGEGEVQVPSLRGDLHVFVGPQ